MRNLYRIELKKALGSPFFRLSTLAASLIALGSAGVAVYHYYYNMSLIGSFGYEENPWLPVNSLYNLWIAEEAYSVLPYLFYVLLPTHCLKHLFSGSAHSRLCQPQSANLFQKTGTGLI